jgi:hypothetical protein
LGFTFCGIFAFTGLTMCGLIFGSLGRLGMGASVAGGNSSSI